MEQSQLDKVEMAQPNNIKELNLATSLRKTIFANIYIRPERVTTKLDNKLWTRCEKKFNGTPQRITVLSDISWQVEHPICERILNISLQKTSSYVYGK